MMNLAVHGLDADVGQTYGSTFTNDQHKTLRADYILANPPFNISQWEGEKLADDPRWVYGIPPTGNANYAWLQHMLARLSARGRAGIVLSNGSMTTTLSAEAGIKRGLIESDVVECMIALPPQLFSNTQIPACVWFLSKDKKSGINGDSNRQRQILFIDASTLASGQVSRTQIELTEDDIQNIGRIYHAWRGTEFSDDGDYEDVEGVCKSVSLDEVAQQGYLLAPNIYVGGARRKKASEIGFKEGAVELCKLLEVQVASALALETLDVVEEFRGPVITAVQSGIRGCFEKVVHGYYNHFYRAGEARQLKPFGSFVIHTIGGDWGSDEPSGGNQVRVAIIRGTDIPDLQTAAISRVPVRYTSEKKIASRQLIPGDIVIEVSGGSKDQPTGRALLITDSVLSRFDCPVVPASFCRLLRFATPSMGLYAWAHLSLIYSEGRTWDYQNQSTGLANFQMNRFLEQEMLPTPTAMDLATCLEHLDPMVRWSQAPTIELLVAAHESAKSVALIV